MCFKFPGAVAKEPKGGIDYWVAGPIPCCARGESITGYFTHTLGETSCWFTFLCSSKHPDRDPLKARLAGHFDEQLRTVLTSYIYHSRRFLQETGVQEKICVLNSNKGNYAE